MFVVGRLLAAGGCYLKEEELASGACASARGSEGASRHVVVATSSLFSLSLSLSLLGK